MKKGRSFRRKYFVADHHTRIRAPLGKVRAKHPKWFSSKVLVPKELSASQPAGQTIARSRRSPSIPTAHGKDRGALQTQRRYARNPFDPGRRLPRP